VLLSTNTYVNATYIDPKAFRISGQDLAELEAFQARLNGQLPQESRIVIVCKVGCMTRAVLNAVCKVPSTSHPLLDVQSFVLKWAVFQATVTLVWFVMSFYGMGSDIVLVPHTQEHAFNGLGYDTRNDYGTGAMQNGLAQAAIAVCYSKYGG
jgi:hypothetical protein